MPAGDTMDSYSVCTQNRFSHAICEDELTDDRIDIIGILQERPKKDKIKAKKEAKPKKDDKSAKVDTAPEYEPQRGGELTPLLHTQRTHLIS